MCASLVCFLFLLSPHSPVHWLCQAALTLKNLGLSFRPLLIAAFGGEGKGGSFSTHVGVPESPRLALGESLGAAVAAAHPISFLGTSTAKQHLRGEPLRSEPREIEEDHKENIYPPPRPRSLLLLHTCLLLSLCLAPSPSSLHPCFLCSYFASFTFISVRQVCLSGRSVCLSDSKYILV